MSDPNTDQNPLDDGSVPADADLASDVADADLLPGGSPASGDGSEESRDDIEPDAEAPLP